MKKMKKLVALIIATAMVLAMAIPTLAGTITITDNGNAKVADHTFSAYCIFTGTLAEDGETLTDIEWGAGVDSTSLLTALKADTTIGSKFTNAASAADVAKALKGATAAEMTAFSRVVAENLGTAAKENVKGGVIDGLADGYYFVKDTTEIEDGDAASAYIVQLAGTANLTIKTDVPTIEKKLKNHDEAAAAYRDANNVGIGDTVDYQIKSKVPDMANYQQYYFIVNDTLSKGLTFDESSLVVKVGDDTLSPTTSDEDEGKTYKLTKGTGEGGATTLEIVFSNFKQYTNAKGADVVITYSAELNSDAEIGKDGNPNEVDLTYSNNPNKEGEGKNKPGQDDDDVTGTTPKDTVITYSTNLKIKKVDENGAALDGVTFTVSGYAKNDKITYTEAFEEAADGEYYALATNPVTYTKTAPTALTAAKYQDVNKKYKLVVKKGGEAEDITYAAAQGTTANGGYIDIGALIADGSLPAGTYVIHEDSTVSGYNLLDHDIFVTVSNKMKDNNKDIDFEEPAKNETITWTVTGEGATVKDDGTIEIEIQNQKGSVLPSTGGMGTTIFYIVGAILVIGAGVVLVTRRRMEA